ncbi:MAG: hypothetical protein EAZ73_09140 [Oscillatoriales cyanobacterium]|nr:hypothetical protein [Microcoleus sp. PH2017_11_PCY_U_A]TAF00861.1 MAG: hypothetical protein EAZ79_01455 [Oscillatoriales cyanobacterium]TAF21380.1 MAG: hypothetical protein EAZ73_09140 [Oscillatoriales cyanobacterium]TAF39693.1 MAG: hypothetical protein EAZ69_00205 [Oscillatoriales cyanobacterium]
MIHVDRNSEQLTLKLRDAVRIMFWQNFNPELRQQNPTQAHAEFYSWWYKQPFVWMDWCQFREYLWISGMSIEQALFVRENYYCGLMANSSVIDFPIDS